VFGNKNGKRRIFWWRPPPPPPPYRCDPEDVAVPPIKKGAPGSAPDPVNALSYDKCRTPRTVR